MDIELVGPAFQAMYSGRCAACGEAIEEGMMIRRVDSGGWAHADGH